MLNDIKADAFRASGRTSLATVLSLALFQRTFRPVLTLRLCRWTSTRSRIGSV